MWNWDADAKVMKDGRLYDTMLHTQGWKENAVVGSRGQLRYCEIFANLRLIFVWGSTR